jgi:hypothetical protein
VTWQALSVLSYRAAWEARRAEQEVEFDNMKKAETERLKRDRQGLTLVHVRAQLSNSRAHS